MTRVVCAVAVLATVLASTAAAQRTTLTVATLPLIVTTTTANDFDAGAVSLGSVTFTVDATTNNPAFANRETTVQILCVNGNCPNTGSLGITGLQWRLGLGGTWTQITTAYVTVETRDLVYNGTNDPWSNTVYFRYLISWTGNPPAAMSRFRIRFRLVVAPS